MDLHTHTSGEEVYGGGGHLQARQHNSNGVISNHNDSNRAQEASTNATHNHDLNSSTNNLFLPNSFETEYHDPGESSRNLTEGFDTAATSSTSISPFSRHLGRNRACASCRDRKLKCDGARPICGQCARAWASKKRSLRAKGALDHELRDFEQPCVYLDVSKPERGASASKGPVRTKGKVKESELTPLQEADRDRLRLEQENAELRARLQLQHNNAESSKQEDLTAISHGQPNSDELSIAEILATTMRSGEGFPISDSRPPSVSSFDAQNLNSLVGSLTGVNGASHMAKLAAASLEGNSHIYSNAIESMSATQSGVKEPIDPILLNSAGNHYKNDVSQHDVSLGHLIPSNWPADFPSPALVDRLCRIFFERCAYAHLPFQPCRFFEKLSLGPSSPQFPSHILLHAIFAMAYMLQPDVIDPTSMGIQHGTRTGGSLETKGGLNSAKFHCEQAKRYLLNASGLTKDLVSVCKAACILANLQFAMAETVEAWTTCGIACKLATCLSLNRSTTTDVEKSVGLFVTNLIPPPSTWIEEEERRRTMFFVVATDVAAAALLRWTSGVKEADVTTPLPLCTTPEFDHERMDGMREAQTLQSPDLFTRHYYNPCVLMIKSLILLGRCGEYLAHVPITASADELKSAQWHHLNHLVSAYTSSLPTDDTLAPHSPEAELQISATMTIDACTIQLHEPLLRFEAHSLNMCRAACSAMTGKLRYMAACDVDVAAYSPSFASVLGIAGRTLVRLLDVACNPSTSPSMFHPTFDSSMSGMHRTSTIQAANPDYNVNTPLPFAQMAGHGGQTNTDMEKSLQDEIDLIFIFMCKYGRTWPLGMRQARAMAAQLGVQVTSPELLRFGLFTDRNKSNHVYR